MVLCRKFRRSSISPEIGVRRQMVPVLPDALGRVARRYGSPYVKGAGARCEQERNIFFAHSCDHVFVGLDFSISDMLYF